MNCIHHRSLVTPDRLVPFHHSTRSSRERGRVNRSTLKAETRQALLLAPSSTKREREKAPKPKRVQRPILAAAAQQQPDFGATAPIHSFARTPSLTCQSRTYLLARHHDWGLHHRQICLKNRRNKRLQLGNGGIEACTDSSHRRQTQPGAGACLVCTSTLSARSITSLCPPSVCRRDFASSTGFRLRHRDPHRQSEACAASVACGE